MLRPTVPAPVRLLHASQERRCQETTPQTAQRERELGKELPFKAGLDRVQILTLPLPGTVTGQVACLSLLVREREVAAPAAQTAVQTEQILEESLGWAPCPVDGLGASGHLVKAAPWSSRGCQAGAARRLRPARGPARRSPGLPLEGALPPQPASLEDTPARCSECQVIL